MAFKRPTTTPTPDEIFDEWVHKLKHAELLALLYIVRRTFGFRDRYGEIKDGDTISLRQFHEGIVTRAGKRLDHGCGVRSKTSLTAALKHLEELGLIRVRRSESAEKGNETTWFALAFVGDDGGDVPLNGPAPPDRADETWGGLGDGGVSVAPDREVIQGEYDSRTPPGTIRVLPEYADRTGGAARIVPGGVRKTHPQQTDETTNSTKQQTDISKRGRRIGHGKPPLDSTDSIILEGDISPMVTTEPEVSPVTVTVAHLAAEFGDDAPHASRTRVLNMQRASGLDDAALLALLDEAAAITRSQAAAITKRGRSGGIVRMPYLLATLRTLVDTPDTITSTALVAMEDVSTMPMLWAINAPDTDYLPAATEAAAVWRAVLTEMRRDGTRENYATWFAPTQALALEGEMLRVVVPTESHRQWLEHKLRRSVERALERTGHAGVHVVYDVVPLGDGPPTGDQAMDQVEVIITPAPGAAPPSALMEAAEFASQAAMACSPRLTVTDTALSPAVTWDGVP